MTEAKQRSWVMPPKPNSTWAHSDLEKVGLRIARTTDNKQRADILHREAQSAARYVHVGLLDAQTIATRLGRAALASGLSEPDVERILGSAFQAAGLE